MPAFIGRVAIKLAVKGGSLRWTFDSDAVQKWSLFHFFEKYYLQLLTTSETELMNIIITKIIISIRKKLSLSQHALKNSYLVNRCVQFGRQLWLRRKERGKDALEKNQMEKNKRKSSIKGRDNEKERKTCPGEKSIEIINQSLRQWRTFTWSNFIECG